MLHGDADAGETVGVLRQRALDEAVRGGHLGAVLAGEDSDVTVGRDRDLLSVARPASSVDASAEQPSSATCRQSAMGDECLPW
jgi:hypothetical protein